MSRPPTGQSALGSQRNEPQGQVALVALAFHLQGYPTPSVQGSGLPLGHPKHSDVEAGGLDNFEKKIPRNHCLHFGMCPTKYQFNSFSL